MGGREGGEGEGGRGGQKRGGGRERRGGSSSSSSGARSGTDIGDHASPNISVIRQLQKI